MITDAKPTSALNHEYDDYGEVVSANLVSTVCDSGSTDSKICGIAFSSPKTVEFYSNAALRGSYSVVSAASLTV